jgi:hypothetical protein
MTQLVITLLRVHCDEVTDDFLEGMTDEVGWKLKAKDGDGKQVLKVKELPMAELSSVARGSDHEVNRELVRLSHEWREAELEFWDHDIFTPNDLLGRLHITRDGAGQFTVKAGKTAEDLGDGQYHMTGQDGDYRFWVKFEELPDPAR